MSDLRRRVASVEAAGARAEELSYLQHQYEWVAISFSDNNFCRVPGILPEGRNQSRCLRWLGWEAPRRRRQQTPARLTSSSLDTACVGCVRGEDTRSLTAIARRPRRGCEVVLPLNLTERKYCTRSKIENR